MNGMMRIGELAMAAGVNVQTVPQSRSERKEKEMNKRVEVFSAGCSCCEAAARLVSEVAGLGDQLTVLDMQDRLVQQRAEALGIHRVPAVVVDGELADCCAAGPVDAEMLRHLGLGAPRE